MRTSSGGTTAAQCGQYATASIGVPHGSWTNSRGGTVRRLVHVAPGPQRVDRGPEIPALLRQDVLVAVGPLLVALAGEDPLLDEALEATREHGAGHVETLLEVVEAADAEEDVAEDQQRPALSDDLERAGERAVLGVVGPGQHSRIVPLNPLTGLTRVVSVRSKSNYRTHDGAETLVKGQAMTDAPTPTQPSASFAGGRTTPGTRTGWIFAVIAVGAFMAQLDLFIVNIAFPAIEESFPGSTPSSLSWVLNAYAIVFAACLVPAGRLADLLGRRKTFQLGLIVFAVASAACALAPTLAVLVAARAGQAVGAALLIPTSLGLLLHAFPPARRAGAIGAWVAVGAVAAAGGPGPRRPARRGGAGS